MRPFQAGNSRLWLKTVISCQHRRGDAARAPAERLSRITVYLFVAGHGRCLLAKSLVAEAVISHPGPQGPKEGPPGQDGDNRSANGDNRSAERMTIMRAEGSRGDKYLRDVNDKWGSFTSRRIWGPFARKCRLDVKEWRLTFTSRKKNGRPQKKRRRKGHGGEW